MNKTYHYEIPSVKGEDGLPDGVVSGEFNTIEECVATCKADCEELEVDYNSNNVKLYLSNDFGETYEECTEEGELI